MNTEENKKQEAHYDAYDYATFWSKERNYEDLSDKIAVNRLLKKTKGREAIMDVGGGLGRLIPCYAPIFKEATLLDPSSVQLQRTEKELNGKYPNVHFIQGVAEQLPKQDNSLDVIVCVRVSHHIPDIAPVFREYHRVLKPGGYAIMEIANKLHIKSSIKAIMKGKYKQLKSEQPMSARVRSTDESIAFVNHNPHTIIKLMHQEGFEIVSILSVSNFRSGFFKKVLPLSVLGFFERIFQKPLASLWFGPSIYFLIRKK